MTARPWLDDFRYAAAAEKARTAVKTAETAETEAREARADCIRIATTLLAEWWYGLPRLRIFGVVRGGRVEREILPDFPDREWRGTVEGDRLSLYSSRGECLGTSVSGRGWRLRTSRGTVEFRSLRWDVVDA